ncbi:hypothetical protein ACFYVL_40415 [Streptomyces sp. NPDC004111]
MSALWHGINWPALAIALGLLAFVAVLMLLPPPNDNATADDRPQGDDQ